MLISLYSFFSTIIQYFWSGHISSSSSPILPEGWKVCNNPSDTMTIKKLSYNPDPPIRSKPLSIDFVGNLSKSITGGRVSFVVKLGGITLHRANWDLCETLKMEPQVPQCPLKKGLWKVHVDTEIPYHAIPATYGIEAEVWDQDDNRVNCIKADIRVRGVGEAESEKEKEANEFVIPIKNNYRRYHHRHQEEKENEKEKLSHKKENEKRRGGINANKLLKGNIIYMDQDEYYNDNNNNNGHDIQ